MSKPSPHFILSLSATLLMVGVGMIVTLLPQRIHEITGTLEHVGLIASVFALAYLAAQVPVGVLADRFGAKWFVVAGYLTCGLSGLVFFSSQTAGGLYLDRAIQGLGEAPIWALGPAVLSVAYPVAKGRAIGIYNASIHAGLTLGPLLGLALAPTGAAGCRFWCLRRCAWSPPPLSFCFFERGPVPALQVGVRRSEVRNALRQKRPAILLVGTSLYGAGYGIFVSILPASLTATHGFDRTTVSVFFVLFYAAVSLSQIVGGALSDRFGRHGFLVGGMGAAAVGTATFSVIFGVWALLPLGLASVGLGLFCVASISELTDCVSDAFKGTISGSYYLFWGAGYVLYPVLIGLLASGRPSVGFLSLALAFALGALATRHVRE